MDLVDTHCHIHSPDYPLDRDDTIKKAKEAGVQKIICVATTLADSQAAIEFAAGKQNVWASAGVHPHYAGQFVDDLRMQAGFTEILELSSISAIGEIGLDYYKKYSSPKRQKKALELQIEAGLSTGLPFIFHIRDAFEDFWKIYDYFGGPHGVIHSFSAGPKQLEQVLRRDLYVGLNGIMTFTADETQLDAARTVPLERLLLETDAPYLAPKPHRGQTCEPKHVLNIAEFLASLRNERLEDLGAATTANAEKLFGLS